MDRTSGSANHETFQHHGSLQERWIQRSSVTTINTALKENMSMVSHAPMTWLDFQLAADQATSIAKILSDRWPDHAAKIQAQLVSLRADLLQLHHSMLPIATKLDGIPLLASHPVYEYLAKALPGPSCDATGNQRNFPHPTNGKHWMPY